MQYSIVFVMLLAAAAPAAAQTGQPYAFEAFAARNDSLFLSACTSHNIKQCNALADGFLQRYNALDTTSRQTYRGYLINVYYNMGCALALTGNAAGALDYLQKAVAAGYNNYAHLLEDADLQTLHNNPAFTALAQQLRQTGDYPYILRRAAAYNGADARPLPAFTYQVQGNPNLVALRRAFNLDSVAGTGSDVSKILSLMHWLHNLVPHDGNHNNPAVKNALSMLQVCKKEGRGLNCRGLATVLNECYLALGFASRFVTCLPKDSLGVDNDCHVINAVYAPSLKKWLWIDPTFDTYVMNEKGSLLSIEEVRQRIINEEPLIISPDANWNHQQSETKQYYLFYYMAKNLYRLECPVNSVYDAETGQAGKQITYLQLLPLDYFKQPTQTVWQNPATQTTLITFYTNNPAYFWQAPQSN